MQNHAIPCTVFTYFTHITRQNDEFKFDLIQVSRQEIVQASLARLSRIGCGREDLFRRIGKRRKPVLSKTIWLDSACPCAARNQGSQYNRKACRSAPLRMFQCACTGPRLNQRFHKAQRSCLLYAARATPARAVLPHPTPRSRCRHGKPMRRGCSPTTFASG